MGKTEIIIFFITVALVTIALVTAIAVFIFQFRKKTIEYNNEKELTAQSHRQELLSSQLEIQQQTMQHIGREIHDNVGQKLTLASLYALRLGHNNQEAAINEPLTSINTLINESLTELRNLSKNLTGNDLLLAGLEDLVKKECEKVNELGHCRAEVIFGGQPVQVSQLVKTIVLRILQEFMQNSLKYAACKTIRIKMNQDAAGLLVLADDDGTGFDAAADDKKGIGLKNMRKRAEMIGADYLLQSEKEKGTSLKLFIPVNKLNL
jgi:signal transduction histidine kinase